jgi:large subunit ribosomal protein L3
MGGKRISVRNLKVMQVLPEDNLLVIRGSIPGHMNALIEIVKL